MKNIDLYNILSYSHTASIDYTDTEMISKYIEVYGKAHKITASKNKNIKSFLRYWVENKNNLFFLLGNRFIYEFPIALKMTEQEKINNMEKALIKYQGFLLRDELLNKIKLNSNYNDLLIAIKANYCSSALVLNKWTGGKFVYNKDGQKININNNMKITTALKKLSNYFECEHYEEFRLAHSKGNNLNTLEGTMCFSIHPLDYFTVADNLCGWDTCLSWKKEGGNCLGTIELMNSQTAIIAYLKSKTDMSIPDGKWNNKKWREVFFINQNFLLESKSYPYRNDDLTKIAINKLLSLLNIKNLVKTEILNNDNFIINNISYNFCEEPSYMYNDFKWISGTTEFPAKRKHYAYFSQNFLNNSSNKLSLNLTGPAICIYCNKEIQHTGIKGQAGNLCCVFCASIHKKCSCCGKICFDNSIMYLENIEKEYCEECCLNNCANDDIDLQLWPKQDLARIFIVEDNKHPEDGYLCYMDILDPLSRYNKKRNYNLNLYFKKFHFCNLKDENLVANYQGHKYYVEKQNIGILNKIFTS